MVEEEEEEEEEEEMPPPPTWCTMWYIDREMHPWGGAQGGGRDNATDVWASRGWVVVVDMVSCREQPV